MINRNWIFLLMLVLLSYACTEQSEEKEEVELSSAVLVECNEKLTDALVERHFTPPVAARNYAYSNIAFYTSIEPFYDDLKSLNGQITDFQCEVKPADLSSLDINLVSYHSFMQVALKLVYGDTVIGNHIDAELAKYKSTLDKEIYENSIAYSKEIVAYVQSWAKGDLYEETRNYSEFTFGKELGNWKPTSPDFMPAIEPHWGKIRPLVMDSSNQFEPIRPTEVSVSEGSQFMTETKEVLFAVDTINEERKEIANFWDCNPNISHHHGHLMFFLQKISPGGHWIHIATKAVSDEKLPLNQGASVMTTLGIGLHDAFVACWQEKYNSNYIRPETVIRKHLDKQWEPILQTPAFPEYPSGHSVASAAAATILTDIVGDNYSFLDSTEVEYGLPAREFSSFREASDEAAISRLYGGIHFMPAITEGVKMGNKVGELTISKISLLQK